MIDMVSVALVIIVAGLWGVTNPLLKKSSAGIENISKNNWINQSLAELKFLAFNLSYVKAFIFNQLGAIIFLYTLSVSDLSLVVPLTNSLAFVVTAVVGNFFGEESLSKMGYFGASLICTGIGLCVASKS